MPQNVALVLTPRQAADAKYYTSLAARRLGVPEHDIALVRVVKRSIDARQRQPKVNLTLEVYVDREPQKEELQRVKQPACGDRSDADWQSTDSDAEDDSSAARRRQPPVWLWILLIVVAAPVVLPIVFGLLVTAISVLFALFITGIALLVCGIVCTGAGIWALIQAFTQIAAWPAAAMIGIGISLAAIGIGVLLTLLMGWLIGKVVPTGVRALCNCLHRIVTRKGGRAV